MKRSGMFVWATLAQVVLVVATAFPWATHGLLLGEPTWHHNASLVAVLVLSLFLWRPLVNDRAFIGIGILITTVLALISGFLILYLKQQLKGWGLKDWAKFWHIFWSWAALVWAVTHTALNWAPFKRMLARWHQTGAGYGTYLVPWLLILLAIPVSWSPLGARYLQETNYIPLTLWTWLFMLGPTYAAWIATRVRLHRVASKATPTLRPFSWSSRVTVQSFVDIWLVPMTILANISGFPLLYFATKETSLKYVAKYWHTWPSIAMAIIVFAHSVQFWPGVRRHWKTLDTATSTA